MKTDTSTAPPNYDSNYNDAFMILIYNGAVTEKYAYSAETHNLGKNQTSHLRW